MRVARPRLGGKLFLASVLSLVVGAVVLWATVQTLAPIIVSEHLAAMPRLFGQPPEHLTALLNDLLAAVNTAVGVAAVAAVLTAAAVSLFVTRRIAASINAMSRVTTRIAAGRYGERVPVTSADELGELAVNVNQMAGSLERVEARRRDLIADVAHELRTPLAGIAGYMEGLLDGVVPATPETYHRVARETARLRRLVDDLQELSRAEAGLVALHLRHVEVRELIDAAVGRFRPQFADKGVGMSVQIGSGSLPVLADPDRIGQVLTNLLGNALQYTLAGGRVEVRAGRVDGTVAIAVSDSGIGIASEHLPHVFERFYRADRSRARASGGSGIGLTIARHLVEAHGGSIQAESAGAGRGSTFTITLPLAK
jgi:signal transduction histidine kinase